MRLTPYYMRLNGDLYHHYIIFKNQNQKKNITHCFVVKKRQFASAIQNSGNESSFFRLLCVVYCVLIWGQISNQCYIMSYTQMEFDKNKIL